MWLIQEARQFKSVETAAAISKLGAILVGIGILSMIVRIY